MAELIFTMEAKPLLLGVFSISLLIHSISISPISKKTKQKTKVL